MANDVGDMFLFALFRLLFRAAINHDFYLSMVKNGKTFHVLLTYYSFRATNQTARAALAREPGKGFFLIRKRQVASFPTSVC